MSHTRVTLRDVAAAAGVSHQTVSRVINRSRRVAPDTRARVEAAIARLDYRPHAFARSMARGRAGALACLAPNLTDYTFASLIESAQLEARERGYFLLSASAPDAAAFQEQYDQLLGGRRTDGLVVINPFADSRHELLSADVPTVFAGARPRQDAASSVALDDAAVARTATQHLLDLGHRAIAIITGPMAEDCSQDRLDGYTAALRDAGVEPDPRWTIHGDWSADSGHAAYARLAALPAPVTAVFAQNDLMAIGLLRAAQDAGVAVPDQLSIIGVDDIPLSRYVSPPLTTLRQPFDEIGRRAAQLLIDAIETPDDTGRRHLTVAAALIRRRSTGPAAGAHP